MRMDITIIALGPGDPKYLTLEAADALRSAASLVLRTARHPVADWLTAQGIAFSSLDALYDAYEDFEQLHQTMAEEVLRQARRAPLAFAVPDPAQDGAVSALYAHAPKDAKITVLHGISQADITLRTADGGYRVLPATAVDSAPHDPSLPLVITEMDSAVLAGLVKLRLTDIYPDEMGIWFYPSTVQTSGKPKHIPLCELDRQKHYDHTVRALIPPVDFRARTRFTLTDLADIMEILRAPDGCPWDRAQTHQSLRRYLLEEAYEAAGAIDEGDDDHLADELGDVLLQIVFHASIGQQHGSFTLTDVTSAICKKMIYRHEHIFGGAVCATASDVSAHWEELKKAEKGLHTQADVLRDVSIALPALTRAAKVQKKAADVGFDWQTPAEALPKVYEEADEVQAELPAGTHLPEEVGDLFLACVNVARLAGIDPEQALTAATDKFIQRFDRMERLMREEGTDFQKLTLAEMEAYWERVKHQGEV